MRDISVKFIFNLKAGFFKTETYILLILQESLKLIPFNEEKNEEKLIISYSDINSISVSREVPAELEIRTNEDTYIGTIPKTEDINALREIFKKVFGKKFSSS